MMSLWDALRMNMMISYQELVRTFLSYRPRSGELRIAIKRPAEMPGALVECSGKLKMIGSMSSFDI